MKKFLNILIATALVLSFASCDLNINTDKNSKNLKTTVEKTSSLSNTADTSAKTETSSKISPKDTIKKAAQKNISSQKKKVASKKATSKKKSTTPSKPKNSKNLPSDIESRISIPEPPVDSDIAIGDPEEKITLDEFVEEMQPIIEEINNLYEENDVGVAVSVYAEKKLFVYKFKYLDVDIDELTEEEIEYVDAVIKEEISADFDEAIDNLKENISDLNGIKFIFTDKNDKVISSVIKY